MISDTNPAVISFLSGGGELGQLTREHNWANTPLGLPHQWPQSLRTAVSLILSSKFPMFLWWGNELIQFYNDAYRPSLGNQGKHPTALGQKCHECWPEIWPIIKPLIDQVMTGGEAVWMKDQLIPIDRNGQLEAVYWTFSYGAVLTESDQIGGVLVVCQETTETVLNQQKLAQSEARFRSIVEQSPIAIGLLSGRDMIIEVGNDKIFEVWGKHRSITGMRLIDALPELKNQNFIQLLEGVYDTGQPFFGSNALAKLEQHGKLEDIYFDFVYTPLRSIAGSVTGIMVLATEVTEQVLARQKVEENETRFRNLSEQLDRQVQERTDQLLLSVHNLQRSNDNLQQFAYIASHDLQEPLRKIQSFGDLLKSQYATQLGDGAGYLERMQLAAGRMSTLIKDLLTYARISTQQEATGMVSLNDVVQDVLADLDLVIGESGAVVHVDSLPTVWGDPSQLGQFFQNIVSNALKFRQLGISPAISISSRLIESTELPALIKPARQAKSYYRIDISDNGIGFDEKYTDRIFQVFQRLHGKNEFAGTGIGLAICERVATNHGGAISARSQPNKGATFSLYLPTSRGEVTHWNT